MSNEDRLRQLEIILEEADKHVMRNLMRGFELENQTETAIYRQPTEHQLREIQRQMIDNPFRKEICALLCLAAQLTIKENLNYSPL